MIKLLAGTFLCLFAISCGAGDNPTATVMRDLDTSSFISINDAINAAVSNVQGGYPISAKLSVEPEDSGEPTHYEVLLFVAGQNDIMDASVNVANGDVFEVEVADHGQEGSNSGE